MYIFPLEGTAMHCTAMPWHYHARALQPLITVLAVPLNFLCAIIMKMVLYASVFVISTSTAMHGTPMLWHYRVQALHHDPACTIKVFMCHNYKDGVVR